MAAASLRARGEVDPGGGEGRRRGAQGEGDEGTEGRGAEEGGGETRGGQWRASEGRSEEGTGGAEEGGCAWLVEGESGGAPEMTALEKGLAA